MRQASEPTNGLGARLAGRRILGQQIRPVALQLAHDDDDSAWRRLAPG